MSFHMYATPIASGLSQTNQETSQVNQWEANQSMSIYVHWVPDGLTQQGAADYFSFLGRVSRVEFVLNKNSTGRMMFVHFHSWNHSDPYANRVRDAIGAAHPEGYPMQISIASEGFQTKYNNYRLMCRINTRPIPVVEYNTHQLSDMFQRLNERVTGEIEVVRNENVRIMQEFDAYRSEMNKTVSASKMMEQILSDEIIYLKQQLVRMMEPHAFALREIPEKPVLLRRRAQTLSNGDLIELQENLDGRFSNAV